MRNNKSGCSVHSLRLKVVKSLFLTYILDNWRIKKCENRSGFVITVKIKYIEKGMSLIFFLKKSVFH